MNKEELEKLGISVSLKTFEHISIRYKPGSREVLEAIDNFLEEGNWYVISRTPCFEEGSCKDTSLILAQREIIK